MNQTFDIRRFCLLFRKTLMEKPAQLLGLCALSLIVVAVSYFIVKNLINFPAAQNMSFMFGILGGGSILASLVFNYFSSGASSASYLTLPASQFEKWLCAILIAVVLYVSVFLLFYRVVDNFFVDQFHRSLNANRPHYQEIYNMVYTYSYLSEPAQVMLMFYLNVAGAMLIGSLYFNKVGYIKVGLLIAMLLLLTYLLNNLAVYLIFGKVEQAVPFNRVYLKAGDDVGTVGLPGAVVQWRNRIITYILPPVLWILAYIRLKEKEV